MFLRIVGMAISFLYRPQTNLGSIRMPCVIAHGNRNCIGCDWKPLVITTNIFMISFLDDDWRQWAIFNTNFKPTARWKAIMQFIDLFLSISFITHSTRHHKIHTNFVFSFFRSNNDAKEFAFGLVPLSILLPISGIMWCRISKFMSMILWYILLNTSNWCRLKMPLDENDFHQNPREYWWNVKAMILLR